jgi:hypothetical protein
MIRRLRDNYWCRRSDRHEVEAPRDFGSDTRLFANPLILKAVSLNHLKVQGISFSDPFHSTLSIPVYSGPFYHNSITVGAAWTKSSEWDSFLFVLAPITAFFFDKLLHFCLIHLLLIFLFPFVQYPSEHLGRRIHGVL